MAIISIFFLTYQDLVAFFSQMFLSGADHFSFYDDIISTSSQQ
ncbi:hypothetical protein M153_2496000177 [Pseudoloma neurophilia]|uniref:Uncharacterized protein n=1 Tax=Pseudoloma neurophilia TaxID=146866 RepID=A0A0R0M385_9MICR|nr:hypothetical protein M153_2496000177 [Pseudoloma neurophilia]